MKELARRTGPTMVKLLDKTGFKTPKEFFRETHYLERVFLAEALKEHEKQEANKLKKMMP